MRDKRRSEEREHNAKMVTRMGVMWPQTKKCQTPLAVEIEPSEINVALLTLSF